MHTLQRSEEVIIEVEGYNAYGILETKTYSAYDDEEAIVIDIMPLSMSVEPGYNQDSGCKIVFSYKGDLDDPHKD